MRDRKIEEMLKADKEWQEAKPKAKQKSKKPVKVSKWAVYDIKKPREQE